MSFPLRLPFLPLACVFALAFSACQNRSPTEPARVGSTTSSSTAASQHQPGDDSGLELSAGPGGSGIAARLAAVSAEDGATAAGDAGRDPVAGRAAARGGNPTGNGNGGNGNGNGGKGKGGNPRAADLRLEIQPAAWNTNWERSEGNVSALLRGTDAAKVDKSSVKLVGEAGEASPRRVQVAGGQTRALFSMRDAFAVLADPDPGERHTVEVHFTVDGGAAQELSFVIRVVGPPRNDDEDDGEDPEVELTVQPATWNTNWAKAQGTVSVLLRGDVAGIVGTSIVLAGDADEISPVGVNRAGGQIRARFRMKQAIGIPDDPRPGQTRTVEVRFTHGTGADATDHELTARVRIVGPRG
jgi:hypothetical protein